VVGLLGAPKQRGRADAADAASASASPSSSSSSFMPPPASYAPSTQSAFLRTASSSRRPAPTCGPVPYFGVISDGVHVHPAALAIAYRAAPDRLVNVTDAMRATGCGPGRHAYSSFAVDVYNGAGPGDGFYRGVHAVVAGTATLAGAVLPLDACLRNFRDATGCTVGEAVATATAHPARMLGLLWGEGGARSGGAEEEASGLLGGIVRGACGDFVLLDAHMGVVATFLAGRRVFARPGGEG
jgi:N-acetylglucosamine-6-phosphate deacetylase